MPIAVTATYAHQNHNIDVPKFCIAYPLQLFAAFSAKDVAYFHRFSAMGANSGKLFSATRAKFIAYFVCFTARTNNFVLQKPVFNGLRRVADCRGKFFACFVDYGYRFIFGISVHFSLKGKQC